MTSLISYMWYKNPDQGVGNSTVKHGRERFTKTQLVDLSKQICEVNKFDYIVILNIVLLADETDEMTKEMYEKAIKSMKNGSHDISDLNN